MIFQSRFREHTIVMRSATYESIPGTQRVKLVPQRVARFTGPQRLFDSERAAREENWSEEDEKAMIDWLFNHPKYQVDFYVAPGKAIPEEYAHIQRVAPAARICEHFEFIDNDIVRCPEPTTVGRNFCAEHDPDRQVIRKGGGTTTG